MLTPCTIFYTTNLKIGKTAILIIRGKNMTQEKIEKWKACLKEIIAYLDKIRSEELKPPAISIWNWLKQPPRNLTRTQYFNLSDEKRRNLRDEYVRLSVSELTNEERRRILDEYSRLSEEYQKQID